jgi:hypothetical protein
MDDPGVGSSGKGVWRVGEVISINVQRQAVMRDVMAALRRLPTSEEQGEVLRVVAIAMDLKVKLEAGVSDDGR